MPILPIDAQTLFSQIDQVGKEQAAQRESTPQAQSLQASEMARRAEQADRSVTGARPPDEGAEKVKDEKEGDGGRRDGRRRKDHARPGEGETETFADPDLGRHVDLMG